MLTIVTVKVDGCVSHLYVSHLDEMRHVLKTCSQEDGSSFYYASKFEKRSLWNILECHHKTIL